MLKDGTLKLDDLKYQTEGEVLVCAQTNLDSCDALKLDCEKLNEFYGVNVIGTHFLFSHYVIPEEYLMFMSGVRNYLPKSQLEVKQFQFEKYNQTFDYCNACERL